jgi:hypothetical protein
MGTFSRRGPESSPVFQLARVVSDGDPGYHHTFLARQKRLRPWWPYKYSAKCRFRAGTL